MSGQKPQFEILLATHNAGKVSELRAALSRLPVKLIPLAEFPEISSVAEVGQTYQENAALKALGYSRQTGLCALADDSGLEVDALNGQPGVLSARFAGPHASDTERNERLLAALAGQQQQEARRARFVCAMALAVRSPVSREAQLLNSTEAKCEGSIATAPRGSHGFGFDPLFVPRGYQQTFGELPEEVKSKISHRALALDQMREFLQRHLRAS
jgi:XTP/dITP diphosphohydrolase